MFGRKVSAALVKGIKKGLWAFLLGQVPLPQEVLQVSRLRALDPSLEVTQSTWDLAKDLAA